MSLLNLDKGTEPYDLFVFAINAEQTREKYITRMKKFLEIIGIDQEKKLTVQERCRIFADKAWSEEGWDQGTNHFTNDEIFSSI